MRKREYQRSLEAKLDKAWRNKGRQTARCEVCETLPPEERVAYKRLNAHHVVGRRNKTLRYDLRNRCWLCPSHHTLGKLCAHENPMWFVAWFKKNRPEDYKYLQAKRRILSHRTVEDLEYILERLEV